jgi:hypothetical protein
VHGLKKSFIFIRWAFLRKCNLPCVFYIVHSFIQLACAKCDDSLSFSGGSSIPLCYILFPANLLYQLFFHPPSLHPASISWSTSWSCWFPIHIQYSFGNSIFFYVFYIIKSLIFKIIFVNCYRIKSTCGSFIFVRVIYSRNVTAIQSSSLPFVSNIHLRVKRGVEISHYFEQPYSSPRLLQSCLWPQAS